MIDVSAFGTGITIVSTATFPQGFAVSSFADDEAPLDIQDVEVSGFTPLYDGSIFTYDKTSPVLLSLGVLPNSNDDSNLKILMQQRKSSPQILPVPDSVTMVINYSDGGRVILASGSILKGALADSITAQSRKKGNQYHFVFGTFAGAQTVSELISTIANNALPFL